MNLFEVLRGEWGLNHDGEFRADPWFIYSGGQVVDKGFGKAPKEFFSRKLPPGVISPGFVNAHSHIELSFMKDKLPRGSSLTAMGTQIHEERSRTAFDTMRQAAVAAMRHAKREGTSFYCDIANNVEFIRFLHDEPTFNGNRFLELLGFAAPQDQARILKARELMLLDETFFPTVHSIYGSSPQQMYFVREHVRHTCVSIHLLESPPEIDFQFHRGEIIEFLQKIGQHVSHSAMEGKSAVEYLHTVGMLSFKKLLLAHLTSARKEDIELLCDYVPHAAWVLCHRSNQYLNLKRTNWDTLKRSPLRMLIGTDSLATNSDLSVLQELIVLRREERFSERELLKAATWNAYEYLEVGESSIPYFIFPDAKPNIESLSSTSGAIPLERI